MILLSGGEKGGTGKTTLAINIAGLLATDADVILVDCDKQQSASKWAQLRTAAGTEPAITCVSAFGDQTGKEVRRLATKYRHVIVDAGGQDSLELRSVMMAADIFLTTCQASQLDIFTLSKIDAMVQQARIINPDLTARLLITMAPNNPAMNDVAQMREIAGDLRNIKLLESITRHRKAYRSVIGDGLIVTEKKPADEKASAEIKAIFKEIFNHG